MSAEQNMPGDKNRIIEETRIHLTEQNFQIETEDSARPWGAFFVIAKESESSFINTYFSDVEKSEIYKYGENISPKILIVAPNQELSWQYHHRRAELWKVVRGPIGVVQSSSDAITDTVFYENDALIKHDAGVRHRLVGGNDWGVVAEIWQHTNPSLPSDEDDIVRLQDNYGRN